MLIRINKNKNICIAISITYLNDKQTLSVERQLSHCLPSLAIALKLCHTMSIRQTETTMIHTDTRYAQPTVFKLTTSLPDKYIQLDTHGNISKMQSITGKIGNTYMRVVSYVSNDAAAYEEIN
jgi:hypothetical protein